MADSPANGASDVVQVQILCNGRALPDTTAILYVRTRAEMNRIPEAVIGIADGDIASQSFPVMDSDLLIAGTEIEIKAGYGEQSLETIFAGIVVKTRIRLDADREFQLEATCRDKSFRMTLERKSEVYVDQKDSAIISSIIGGTGLQAAVDATDAEHESVVRHSCTDFDFVLARAEANGLLFSAAAGKATVAKPGFSATPKLGVTLGIDLLSFDGEIDARTQYASASLTAWDPDSQGVVKGEASVDAGSKWGNQTGAKLAEVGAADGRSGITASDLEQSTVDNVAKARQTRAALSRLRGVARFQGSGRAQLGDTLELSGVGNRFSGVGLICGVSHRIETGDWTTEAALGLQTEWLIDRHDVADAAAAGLNAAVRGLQIGKVVRVAEDPLGAARIRIKLPLLGDDAQVWARLSGFYASSGFGAFFLPEVDDEVVVGFMDDDPSSPVVLGSLYSKDRAPPETPQEENNLKKILTREQLSLEFDEENKKITILTPAGNTATFDDTNKTVTLKDETGNKVELSTSGILLDSPKSITIKAGQDVSITAGGSISGTASQNVSLSGMNVSASADVGFSASGNASAELTASGNVKIQGALVMIN